MRPVAVLPLLLLAAGAASADELAVRRGAELFGRPWRTAPGGDVVGPLYNERACVGCHDEEAAVTVVFRTLAASPLGRQIQPRAVPGVAPEPEPVLALEPVGNGLRRPRWDVGGVPLAGRLAPSLRGLGLLARIPNAALAAAADPDDRDRDGVSGRRGRGRFGWKAEQADLAGQIGLALSLDLGLATAAHPAPAGDCTPAQTGCLAAAGAGAPVPAADTGALVAYLEALRPRPAAPAEEAGTGLFAALGCAACHAPAYTIASDPAVTGSTTERIAPFTDLLLHDLGPGLADPAAAADAAEWRTAPLWGLRHRKALLHDGRAASPREAVAWHDGEAASSRDRFLALPATAQAALLGYLDRL